MICGSGLLNRMTSSGVNSLTTQIFYTLKHMKRYQSYAHVCSMHIDMIIHT